MIVKNVEKKEHSTAIFQVEVDAEAFEAARNIAYRKEKGKIFVAGFRKGKAPRAVIEGMYGKDVFNEGAMQEVAPDAFDFGVEESKLDTVGAPSIVDYNIGEDGAVTITFSTEVYPEVTLGAYKGLEAEYAEPVVSDERVDAEIEATRKRNARLVDVKRPVKNGDTIIFDFEGFVDGVPFEGGKSEEYTLEIGSGMFIPGFEEQMIGKEIEQEGEINVTFPEAYDPSMAGKDATFKVKVHAVKEPQYPELDDEFAKDISEFDTLDEYKADLKRQMLEQTAGQCESDFHAALMNQAIDAMTAEVPDSMIAEKSEEFLRSYANGMGLPGNIDREDLLKSMGVTEEQFMQIIRPNAMRQVQGDLLLDAVAKAEGIEITDAERDEFYDTLVKDYGEEAEKVKAMIDERLVIQDLTRRKAAEVVYQSAVKLAPAAKDEEKKEKKPAAKKTTKKAAAADAEKDADESAKKPAAKKTAKKAESAESVEATEVAEGEEKPVKKTTRKKKVEE